MQFTFSKGSEFDIPEGKYNARFTGVRLLEDKGAKDKDGKPLPPAMSWDFTVIDGEQAGKKCDRVTGRQPTPKSGCGKMLAAITDQILKDGTQYDVSQFVGKVYRVTVEEKPSGNGTRVSDNPAPVRVYDGAGAPPPTPGGPPRPPKPGHGEVRYWYAGPDGAADPVLKNESEVRDLILTAEARPADTLICREGTDAYRPIAELIPALAATRPLM